jgi:hypothetical protein
MPIFRTADSSYHATHKVRGKCPRRLAKVGINIHAENEEVVIPIQVQWLANPVSIRERRYSGENSALLVVFAVKGKKVAHKMV